MHMLNPSTCSHFFESLPDDVRFNILSRLSTKSSTDQICRRQIFMPYLPPSSLLSEYSDQDQPHIKWQNSKPKKSVAHPRNAAPRKMLTLQELPYDIRLQILGELGSFNDLFNVTQTCKSLAEPFKQHPQTVYSRIAPQHFAPHWNIVIMTFWAGKFSPEIDPRGRLSRVDTLVTRYNNEEGSIIVTGKDLRFLLFIRRYLLATLPFMYPAGNKAQGAKPKASWETLAKAESFLRVLYTFLLTVTVCRGNELDKGPSPDSGLEEAVIALAFAGEEDAAHAKFLVQRYAREAAEGRRLRVEKKNCVRPSAKEYFEDDKHDMKRLRCF